MLALSLRLILDNAWSRPQEGELLTSGENLTIVFTLTIMVHFTCTAVHVRVRVVVLYEGTS